MRIVLQKYGSTTEHDVTGYLKRDESFQMSNEHERDAFERVCGDVHLVFTNMRKQFYSIFGTKVGQEKWICIITKDGVHKFSGEIYNPSIIFSIQPEKVEFDCYSFQKLFWDRCKNKRIRLSPKGNLVYNDLKSVIEYNILDLGLFEDIIRSVDLQDIYTDRQIRWWNDDETAGNTGKYYHLDPKMTVAELFEVFSIFYNLDFIVDYPSRKLIVQRRVFPLSTSPKTVKIKDDTPIEFKPVCGDKYDYIYSVYKYIAAESPVIKSVDVKEIHARGSNIQVWGQIHQSYVNPSGNPGSGMSLSPKFNYYLVAVQNGHEYSISFPATHRIGSPWGSDSDTAEDWLADGHYKGYTVTLIIPKCAEGTTSRRLYRTHYIKDATLGIDKTGMYMVKEFSGNDPVEWVDSAAAYFSELDITKLSENLIIGACAWFGYDEASGSWRDPIIDYANDKSDPLGSKVLDALPKLRFANQNATNQLYDSSYYDIFCFFGKDNSNEMIRTEFLDLLMTKAGLNCTVKDNDVNSGDEITRPELQNVENLPNANFIIKNAVIDFLKEDTKVEMVQL